MTLADQVRKYVKDEIIDPAREAGRGTVCVRAGDIHKALGYKNRLPLICAALDADKFLAYARVRLIQRSGPQQSSTTEWMFAIK